jgi:hypothetical protein
MIVVGSDVDMITCNSISIETSICIAQHCGVLIENVSEYCTTVYQYSEIMRRSSKS